jgi:hypothetical protein
VKLSFADANGTIIRSFDLHLKTKAETKKEDGVEPGKTRTKSPELNPNTAAKGEEPEEEADNPLAKPSELKAKGLQKATAIEPGMNAFQWNLRYPDATEVDGFYTPIAAGGYENSVSGPTVVPGTYRVMLDYGGRTTQQDFQVGLDPRIKADAADLQARFDLLMQIHRTLDQLDRTINRAIETRDRLLASGGPGAGSKVAALNAEIADLVQLAVQSDEGTVLHEVRLRSQLAYVAADVDLAYTRPSAAQYAVFKQLEAEANKGEQTIESLSASIK